MIDAEGKYVDGRVLRKGYGPAAPTPAPGPVLRFMGGEYATVQDLRRDFPAFSGDDAVRAIRAGCQTVMEVEVFCWKHRNGWMEKVCAGARALSKTPKVIGKARSKKRRKAA